MKIGFDLDKIFIDYPPFVPDKLIDRLYKKKSNGVLIYRIPSRPEQMLRKLSHLSFLRPAIQEHLSFLKNIPKENNQLYLISSRFGFLEHMTYKLIKRFNFDSIFTGMYFNFENKQPHLFKSEVLKKLNIDVYVDDDLPLLKYVAKHNKKTKFFWLNGSINKPLTHNITAVTDISDILPKKHSYATS